MLWQLILKDLKVFFSDRRALLISMLVPIGIASFMAGIFGNVGKAAGDVRMSLLVVDQDNSEVSHQVVENLRKSSNIKPQVLTLLKASEEVKNGKSAVALVLPEGFGSQAQRVM